MENPLPAFSTFYIANHSVNFDETSDITNQNKNCSEELFLSIIEPGHRAKASIYLIGSSGVRVPVLQLPAVTEPLRDLRSHRKQQPN
jgi:hypothetical protein